MLVTLFQVYLISWQVRAQCEIGKDKTVGVAFIGAPLDEASALELVLNFTNTKILSDGWKMAVRLLPAANDSYLLQDLTGSGLYQIAENMNDYCLQAIVGPGSSTSAKLMHPYSVKRDVPHILPFATDPALSQTKRFPLMVRLSPPDTYQTKAVLDILQFYGWERLSIITTDNDYGFGVEESLIKLAAKRRIKLEVVKRLKTDKAGYVEEISEVLIQLMHLKSHSIAVAANLDAATYLLQQAFLKGMVISRNWVWILLDGVIDSDILQVEYVNANGVQEKRNYDGLMGTRPAASGGKLLKRLKEFWESTNPGQKYQFEDGFGLGIEKYVDGLVSIASGFEDYRIKHAVVTLGKSNGSALRDAILRINTTGITTSLVFDSDGKINSTKYDILLSKQQKWSVIGEWRSITKLNMSSVLFLNFSKSSRSSRKNIRPRQATSTSSIAVEYTDKPIVHVVTILEYPFVIFGEGNGSYQSEILSNRIYEKSVPPSERKPGMNVQLHGYCIDLLQKISEYSGIRYTLRLVNDSNVGGYDKVSMEWNGLIGDIIRGKSHAAVAPITVTAQRASAVDFSTGFLDVGLKFIINSTAIAALLHRAEDSPGAFGFLLPFEDSLYYAIAICVVCLASFLNFLSRLSPYGARGHFYLGPRVDRFRKKISHLCLRGRELSDSSTRSYHPDEVKKLHSERESAESRMGFNNALYFVWSSLFWQTPETVPRAPSARMLTAVWYLSAVIFVASYTANMVAFVASSNMDGGVWNSVSDLVSQTKIEYGTASDSSVEYIFQSSSIKMANDIYNYLQSSPERLVPTFATGIEKAKNGSYAFFWDSLVLDFEAYKSHCQLRTVSVGFGGVVYAMAFPKNSPLKAIFSRNILRLRESGYLATLWQRYFSEVDKCSQSSPANQHMNFKRLQFEELAGVFYFVAFAMTLGFILLFMEWIWAGIQDVDKSNPKAPKSFSAAMKIRLKRLKQDIIENWFPRKIPRTPSSYSETLASETVYSEKDCTSQDLDSNHMNMVGKIDDSSSVCNVDNGTNQQRATRSSSIRFALPAELDEHQPC